MKKSHYVVPGLHRRSFYLTIATARDLMNAYDKIAGIVSEEFDITPETIKVKNNKQYYVVPRQIVMFLLHYGCGYGPSSIAEACGGWDHATVIRSVQVVGHRRDVEKDYKARLRRIITKIFDQCPEILIVGKSMLNEPYTQP